MSRILLIDDDTDMIAMTTRWLEKAGYEVTGAASGKEALSILTAFHPDLILLDYAMPEMNGSEVLARIRENEEIKNIPVLLRTGMDDTDIGSGADGIVPKADGKPGLLKAIGEIL